MTPLAYAYLASGLASALSLLLARRSPSHRPIAALLCTGLACDAVVRACGREPEGLAFGLAILAGQVYPWAVVGAVTGVMRGAGGWGRKGAGKSHPGAPTCAGGCAHGAVRRCLACEAIPAVSPSGGRSLPRFLALASLFTIYAAALLSSGLRGPALARVYAVAQAVVAVVLVGVVWRWERRRRSAPATLPENAETCTGLALAYRVGVKEEAPAVVPRSASGMPDGATPRPPTATEIAAIICAAAEIANVPAYLGLPHWVGARSVYALAYCALIAAQSHALLRTRRPP